MAHWAQAMPRQDSEIFYDLTNFLKSSNQVVKHLESIQQSILESETGSWDTLGRS